MNPTAKCCCGETKVKKAQFCNTCWVWLPETAQNKILLAAKNLKSARAKAQDAINGANALLHLHRRGKI